MEQWQQLPAGSSSKIGLFDPAKVAYLKDELELSGLPKVRETLLDVHKIVERAVVCQDNWKFTSASLSVVTLAGSDRMGRLIVPIPMGDMLLYNQVSAVMRPMAQAVNKDGKVFEVTGVVLLYTDKIPTHYFLEIEPVEETR
jgi:hypothetical protein